MAAPTSFMELLTGEKYGGYDPSKSGWAPGVQEQQANYYNQPQGVGGAYPIAGGVPSQPGLPAQPSQVSGPSGPSQEDIMREIEGLASSQLGYLGQAQSQLGSDKESVLSDIASQFTAQKGTLETGRTQSGRQIEESSAGVEQRKEDAMAAAVRLFNELNIGRRQRFGGASSAGEAMGQLANVEMQRTSGDISRDYASTMEEIENQKVTIEENYNNGLLQLQTSRDQAINSSNRDFQNKLLEINRMRTEVESNKSAMRLEALQSLRNQVFQIEMQNMQFQQQLEAQRVADERNIANAQASYTSSIGGASTAAQDFFGQTPTSYQTGLTVNQASVAPGYTAPTGVRTKEDEEKQGILGQAGSTIGNWMSNLPGGKRPLYF